MGNNLISAIYFHPEAFPPTLNATGELSKLFDQIYLLYRPHLKNEWKFDANVSLVASGAEMTVQQQEQSSTWKKIKFFFNFTRTMFHLIKEHRPTVVLVYDAIPLFSFYLVKKLINNPPKLWYHNHDVTEKERLKKYSIGWLAAEVEQKMFTQMDIFSLPSQERKRYFPMEQLLGEYIFLPNLPSWKFYGQFKDKGKDEQSLRLLYQGSIGKGHGIEELLQLMPFEINGKPIKLVLKGFLKQPFKGELDDIIEGRNLQGQVEIHGVTPYKDVPRITCSCHIGIAIFSRNDIMNNTLGTASNKIYEYAACGLPVLYYNSDHYSNHLGKYNWAVPTDLTEKSLTDSIQYIDSHHAELSRAAREDFESGLKYEIAFSNVVEVLTRVNELGIAISNQGCNH